MKHIFQKEITSFFSGLHGFLLVTLFAVFSNFLFIKDIFIYGSASMRAFFDFIPWLLMIFISLVTMRSFAHERQNGTMELLQTLPVEAYEVVLGKIGAAICICMIGMILTIIVPVALLLLIGSTFAIETVLVGYIGVLLYITLFVSIGVFISLQTNNQALAGISTMLVIFLTNTLGTDFLAGVVPAWIHTHISLLAPTLHLTSFPKGMLDIRSIWYFVSFTIIFVWFTIADFRKKSL